LNGVVQACMPFITNFLLLLQQSLDVNDDAKLSNGLFGSQNCGHFKILKYLLVCNKGLNWQGLW
jgi:hypothetical protein